MAGCLRRLTPDEIPIAIAFLTGETRQGKLSLAYAELHYGASGTPAPQPSLTLKEVDAAFAELAATSGKGASAARAERLAALFSRATMEERDFLARLIVGELRQGALKGLMLEAVSAVFATSMPLTIALPWMYAAWRLGGLMLLDVREPLAGASDCGRGAAKSRADRPCEVA